MVSCYYCLLPRRTEHTPGFKTHSIEIRAWRLERESQLRDEELERLRSAVQNLAKVIAPYLPSTARPI